MFWESLLSLRRTRLLRYRYGSGHQCSVRPKHPFSQLVTPKHTYFPGAMKAEPDCALLWPSPGLLASDCQNEAGP